MCTSPIIIKNGSRRYRDGIDKMFFHVPCGHCKECLKREQDDWFVRAFFEYKRIEKIGGSVFFPTFSYNDSNLPIWCDDERDVYFPCFCYEHIRSFMKKLRIYLSRDGYDVKDLRMILVSEFGGKKGRPHYHGLFFVPFKISSKDMLKYFRRAWIYGYTMVSKKGLQIQSVNALQYCMKYVSKEQHWRNYYDIDKYYQELKEDVENDVPFADEIFKLLKRSMPRHYQSSKFGFNLIDSIYDDNMSLISGKIDLSKYGFLTQNRFKFSIPRYIMRHILKYKDEFNTDVPTFKSDEIFVERFIYMIENEVQTLSYCQSFESFKSHIPLELPKATLDILWDKISPIKDKLPQLVVYNLVFRDVPIIDRCFDNNDINFYLENALNFAFKQQFNFDVPRDEKDSMKDREPELFSSLRFSYGDLPCFHCFENALKAIEKLNEFISRDSSSAWFKKEEVSVNQYKGYVYECFNPIV